MPIRKVVYTFEEFVDIIPDGVKADLLDGAIYLASSDNINAADLNTWLVALIAGFVERKRLGKVYLSRVAYRLSATQGPEPDIGFLPKSREGTRQRGFINGPPALAIEIVSPDSVGRDYVHKRAVYEQAGVDEYWILDPDESRATFLRLQQGRYEVVNPVRNRFTSKVLPGFWLDVRGLWEDERPDPLDILERLLRRGRSSR